VASLRASPARAGATPNGPPEVRWLTAIRAAWGGVLLTVPGLILHRLPEQPDSGLVAAVARILGLRHLVQAAIVARDPTRERILAGAAVDAAHATSMLALAVLRPDHRALGLADAAVASTFTAAGIREARA
jgi:hypothetical protein